MLLFVLLDAVLVSDACVFAHVVNFEIAFVVDERATRP